MGPSCYVAPSAYVGVGISVAAVHDIQLPSPGMLRDVLEGLEAMVSGLLRQRIHSHSGARARAGIAAGFYIHAATLANCRVPRAVPICTAL